MPEYLILLAQTHESFRKAELESVAAYEGVEVDLSHHDEQVQTCSYVSQYFCILTIDSLHFYM